MIKIEFADGQDIKSVLSKMLKEKLDAIENNLLELEMKHPIKQGRAIPEIVVKK